MPIGWRLLWSARWHNAADTHRCARLGQRSYLCKAGDGMFPSPSIDAARRIAIPLELGLDAIGLVFFPILVLVPHAIAPLISVAGIFAVGLVLPNGRAAFRGVRVPALILVALLVWASA